MPSAAIPRTNHADVAFPVTHHAVLAAFCQLQHQHQHTKRSAQHRGLGCIAVCNSEHGMQHKSVTNSNKFSQLLDSRRSLPGPYTNACGLPVQYAATKHVNATHTRQHNIHCLFSQGAGEADFQNTYRFTMQRMEPVNLSTQALWAA